MDDDLHLLSGAYAVHALPPAELAPFEEHLSGCHGCRGEVRRLRETAARLAPAVPPPPALRVRVLASLRHPPAEAPPPAGARAARAGEPSGRTGPRSVRGGGAGEAPGGARSVRGGGGRGAGRRWAAGVAAAGVAAAVAFGVVAFDARRDLDGVRAREAGVSAVLAAPDARVVRRDVSSGGTGVAVVSEGRGRLVFTASGLAELPEGKVYELWLTGPGGTRPAGLLGRGGTPAPVLAALRDDARVDLTVEPAGGSDRPTTTPVLSARLPSGT